MEKKKELAKFLRSLSPEYAVGVGHTNRYWVRLADMAHDMGFDVYVVDAAKVKSYRESFPGRRKMDRRDAEVIARYVERGLNRGTNQSGERDCVN